VFRLLNNLYHALVFYLGVKFTKLKGWFKPFTKQHKKVSITQVALKAGDSYKLGECIVTLATFGIEGKKEVAAKIEAFEKLRLLKEEKLKKRGEDIMLMSPEDLSKLQVEEWLKKREQLNEKKIYDSLKEPE